MKGSRAFFAMLSSRYNAGSLQVAGHCRHKRVTKWIDSDGQAVAKLLRWAYGGQMALYSSSDTGSCCPIFCRQSGQSGDNGFGVEGQILQRNHVFLHKLTVLLHTGAETLDRWHHQAGAAGRKRQDSQPASLTSIHTRTHAVQLATDLKCQQLTTIQVRPFLVCPREKPSTISARAILLHLLMRLAAREDICPV